MQLVSTTDRDAVGQFLRMPECIDVAIPRGGESLIRRVAAEAKMPVIKHFDGNCHVYVDAVGRPGDGPRDPGQLQVPADGRVQRGRVAAGARRRGGRVPARAPPPRWPSTASKSAATSGRASWSTRAKPATEADYAAEFLGPIISACVVGSLDEAIEHINRYGSHHTDAIVTSDLAAAERFAAGVDSAAVMVNASTRFNDGGEFGLGAEIGISTDKFHARGPCGVDELTSYKYVVHGQRTGEELEVEESR